jgi:uncharacterized membrane protein
MSDHLDYAASEDRTMPAVVYALYLIGLTHGLTIVIGLILAYALRGGAGPHMQSHYTLQIRTFWLTIGWFLLGGLMILVGIPLSIVLVGIPIVMLGGGICFIAWLWFALRSIIGVIYLARGEPYPRPYAWFA